MPDEAKKVSDNLDPSTFATHAVRTAILLEQITKDVQEIKNRQEIIFKSHEDIVIFKERTTNQVERIKDEQDDMNERLRWLSRLIIGAILTGVIGGIIALIFKLVG